MSESFKGKCTLLVGEDYTRIELTDENSGVRVVNITINGPEFLAMLSRGAMRSVEYTVYHPSPLGYMCTIKHEDIDFTDLKVYSRGPDTETEKAIIAPYLVDGFDVIGHGDHADWRNHHREKRTPTGRRIITVAFRRYVHPVTGAIWERDKADV